MIDRFSEAKSEALDNIYSLLKKKNTNSCNAKRLRQRRRIDSEKQQYV